VRLNLQEVILSLPCQAFLQGRVLGNSVLEASCSP